MIGKLVINASDLSNLVKKLLQEDTVAIDTESNSFFGYPDKICLIQLATDSNAWLIDPLLIEDMNPLGELLESEKVQKIIHAAENDLRVIDRDLKFNVRNIFDTSIAASFTGSYRLGLNSILNEHLFLNLSENKTFQKADWTNRPLNKDLIKLVEMTMTILEKKIYH